MLMTTASCSDDQALYHRKHKKSKNEILRNRQFIRRYWKRYVGIFSSRPQSEIIENNKAACKCWDHQNNFGKNLSTTQSAMVPPLAERTPVPQAIKKLKSINNIVMGSVVPITNDLIWLLVDTIQFWRY
jgi:hypothetical protein